MNQEEESSSLKRYSFTLPENLVETVDELSQDFNMNRSMAVREALSSWVNDQVKSRQMSGNGVAVISYIYKHHELRMLAEIMDLQHDYGETIIITSHVHLTHTECFETVICKGDLIQIRKLADSMRSIKGISSFNIEYDSSQITTK